jgi:hypothetical protein
LLIRRVRFPPPPPAVCKEEKGGNVACPADEDRDPVVEAYKADIDRTLLRRNLQRSVAERLANLVALQRLAEEARRAGQRLRAPE